MCKYCQMQPNGDYGEDLQELIHVTETTGRFARNPEAKKTYEDEAFTKIGCYSVGVYGDLLQLNIGDACDVARKINYCPMCGREL